MATYIDLSTLHTPTPRGKPPASWGAQIRENLEWFQQNRRQVCTSSTRPTAFEGLEIYETDTDISYKYDGSDWREIDRLAADPTWSPTWTQSATISRTATVAAYTKQARSIAGTCVLAATSAGTAANSMLVSTPLTAAYASNACIGSGFYYNGSVNLPIIVVLSTTSTFAFMAAFTAIGGYFGQSALFYTSGAAANTSWTPTVANGHQILFNFRYTATA